MIKELFFEIAGSLTVEFYLGYPSNLFCVQVGDINSDDTYVGDFGIGAPIFESNGTDRKHSQTFEEDSWDFEGGWVATFIKESKYQNLSLFKGVYIPEPYEVHVDGLPITNLIGV